MCIFCSTFVRFFAKQLFIGNVIWVVREEVLGTVALCALALYYLVLGMFKDKLQKEFSFTARKK